MKKTKLLIAAGLLALFSSCGDTALDAGDSSESLIQPSAKVSIIVRDNGNQRALQGVKAELLTTGKTGTTGADGIVTFEDVYAGSYILQLTKAGYATMLIPYGTESVSGEIGGVYVVGNETGIIDMFPTSASYEGYLFYENKAGTTTPAGGAWVYIKLGCRIYDYPSPYYEDFDCFETTIDSVQVGADGKYTFNNLPAGAEGWFQSRVNGVYTKIFDAEGRTFVSAPIVGFTSFSPEAGVTKYNNTKTTLTEVAEPTPPFNLINNPWSVAYNEAIIFEFDGNIKNVVGCYLEGHYIDDKTDIHDNETDCENAGFMWFENDWDEICYDYNYENLSNGYDYTRSFVIGNNTLTFTPNTTWNTTHDEYEVLITSCSVQSTEGGSTILKSDPDDEGYWVSIQ